MVELSVSTKKELTIKENKLFGFIKSCSVPSGAPIEKEGWKKILEYLIENAEEIYENIIRLERILI